MVNHKTFAKNKRELSTQRCKAAKNGKDTLVIGDVARNRINFRHLVRTLVQGRIFHECKAEQEFMDLLCGLFAFASLRFVFVVMPRLFWQYVGMRVALVFAVTLAQFALGKFALILARAKSTQHANARLHIRGFGAGG